MNPSEQNLTGHTLDDQTPLTCWLSVLFADGRTETTEHGSTYAAAVQMERWQHPVIAWVLVPWRPGTKSARQRAEDARRAVIAAIEQSQHPDNDEDPVVLHGGKAEREALKALAFCLEGADASGAIFHGVYHGAAFAVQLHVREEDR